MKWMTTTDRYPGVKSTEFVDLRGGMIQSETNLGGIALKTLLADRDLALAKVEPQELLKSMMIAVAMPIERPREAVSAGVCRAEHGRFARGVAQRGAQRVERIDGKSARVFVETLRPREATAEEVADAGYRAPSKMIGSDDAEVKQLAAKARRGSVRGCPRVRRAQALAAGRGGVDQTEEPGCRVRVRGGSRADAEWGLLGHAVLLAAMLRAEGIPARRVGVVYVENALGMKGRGAFGYHVDAGAGREREREEGVGGPGCDAAGGRAV